MKQFYQKMVSTVVWDADTNEADEVMDLEKFDEYMKEMLGVSILLSVYDLFSLFLSLSHSSSSFSIYIFSAVFFFFK